VEGDVAVNSGAKIDGLNELGKLLDGLPAKIQRNVMAGAVKAGADVLVAPLAAAAPVFTGRLEESIVSRREAAGRSRRRSSASELLVSAGIAIVGVAKRYWHFSEFGTVHQPARPWIRPTFAANQAKAVAAVKKYMTKRVGREAKKLARETGAKK
jgi:HK97 gp10 family phage protein